MSKTITEAVSELSQGMSYLELHWENQRLKHRILALEKRLREKSEEFIRMESAWRQEVEKVRRSYE